MQNVSAGIAFHETMQGPFALGETDPQRGYVQGTEAKTELSIICAITIRDLEHFLSEPEHPGEITGSVQFTAFGEAPLPSSRGVFNLFAPSDEPTCKLMVYELAFARNGQNYYLAGRKEVRSNDPAYDLWRDTTTLYTRLHEGMDATGPVIGAGILIIDIDRLLKMIASMHATNAHTLVEQGELLLKFGRFFLGELWDTYGLKE